MELYKKIFAHKISLNW